jgi:hypothetical protein
MGVLAEVEEQLGAFDVDEADDVTLSRAMCAVQRARAHLASAESRISARLAALHRQGVSSRPVDHLVQVGLTRRDAHAAVARSEVLADAAPLAEALAAGTTSPAHVDVLAGVLRRLDDDQRGRVLAGADALAEQAATTNVDQFRQVCDRAARLVQDDLGAGWFERQRRETKLATWIDRTGMHQLRGSFDAETGAVLFRALHAETRALLHRADAPPVGCIGDGIVPELRTDAEHVAAHALVGLVRGGRVEYRGVRTELVVLVDAAGLAATADPSASCETEGGGVFPLVIARRAACDADVTLALLDADRLVLDLGRARKQPDRAQRRALRAMHPTCGFGGCDVPFERCELHHVTPWHLGGRTDLANLLPLCVAHHHLVHEGGWTLTIGERRIVTVVRPDGVLDLASSPDGRTPASPKGRSDVPVPHRGSQATPSDARLATAEAGSGWLTEAHDRIRSDTAAAGAPASGVPPG